MGLGMDGGPHRPLCSQNAHSEVLVPCAQGWSTRSPIPAIQAAEEDYKE